MRVMGYTSIPQQIYSHFDKAGKIGAFFNDILLGHKKFHLVLAGLLLALVSSIQPTYSIYRYGIPYVAQLPQRVVSIVNEVVPDTLEIKINHATATANVEEPYFLTVRRSTLENLLQLRPETNTQNQPQSKVRILTINTQGTAEDFEKYQTYAMLTAKSFIYFNDNEVTITSLSNTPNMTISKKVILGKIEEINSKNKIVNLLTLFLYISPFLMILGYFFSFLLEILFTTFLVWIITKILKIPVPFKRLYTFVGILCIVPRLILICISFFPASHPFYGMISVLFDVLVLAFSYVIISGADLGDNDHV